MFGGQVGIAGHAVVADGVKMAAQTGLPSSVKEPNATLFGSPAIDAANYRKSFIHFKNLDNSTHWEITYHKSLINKPPLIHLKHKSIEQPQKYPLIDKQYVSLALQRLSEPTVLTDFPIPLFKITIPVEHPSQFGFTIIFSLLNFSHS